MIKQNRFLVFDTETAGHIGFPLIYDIAWKVVDRKGRVYSQNSFVIKEIYENKALMDNAYYGSKRGLYDLWLKIAHFEKVSFQEALRRLNEDVRAHKVTHLCAYNLEFDKRALQSTAKYLKIEGKLIKSKVSLQCIWGMACELIASKPMYQTIAREQGWKSEKGNIKTGAEFLYRYLSRDYNFIEEHTALADVDIEVEILLKCLRQNKKYTRGIKSQPWRLAQIKGI